MTFKYLHETSPGCIYLDHRLTPEVRAMLCAMASRAPKGGVRARYLQILKPLVLQQYEGHLDHAGITVEPINLQYHPVEGWSSDSPHTVDWCELQQRAEDRLTTYPLPEKVQIFFDDFVGKYGHCYDPETEVLCRIDGVVGWVRWPDAYESYMSGGSVQLGSYDVANDSIQLCVPKVWIKKPYDGDMYHLKTVGGSIDLMVTPDHNMLVQRHNHIGGGKYAWSCFQSVSAQDVYHRTNYRYKKIASSFLGAQDIAGKDPWGLASIDLYAFGQLCGFFIGDGYAGGKQAGYLSFHLKKERKIVYLRSIADRLQLKLVEHKGNHQNILLNGARDWARECFYNGPLKQIPNWAITAPKDFALGLLDGIHKSDGHSYSSTGWVFHTTSKQVFDSVQILGAMWGLNVNSRLEKHDNPRHKDAWAAVVSAHPKMTSPVPNRGSHKVEDAWDNYSGDVYCASVDTGYLVVRRNGAVTISGNSSILELTGSPSVYVEDVSWFTNWMLFDSPQCAGQEFSTRAVQHKDWPMAREAAGDPELASLHTDWLAVFEAEVQWWTEFFKSPENRAAFGIADKEPFRPALDRARWALPGTIATGSSHTSSLRERARVLDVGGCLTAPDSNANQLWQDVRETYRQALPGLADMGLREAVYKTGTVLPHNVSTLLTRVDPLPKMCTMTVSQSALVPPGVPIRQSKKTYLDPVYNQAQQVDFRIQCSIAVARDWHRHRTAYPWYMHIISDEIQIDPHYEAKSDFAKERVADLLRRSNDCFNRHMADQRVTQAAMALPLGTYVQLAASAGMRDFTYMTELRAFAAGANFEYKDQAEEFLRMM